MASCGGCRAVAVSPQRRCGAVAPQPDAGEPRWIHFPRIGRRRVQPYGSITTNSPVPRSRNAPKWRCGVLLQPVLPESPIIFPNGSDRGDDVGSSPARRGVERSAVDRDELLLSGCAMARLNMDRLHGVVRGAAGRRPEPAARRTSPAVGHGEYGVASGMRS